MRLRAKSISLEPEMLDACLQDLGLHCSNTEQMEQYSKDMVMAFSLCKVLTVNTLGFFFSTLALLVEFFFPILYKIGTFLRSAMHVKFNFGSKLYDSRSL